MFAEAMEAYDREGQHSMGISAVIDVVRTVEITHDVIMAFINHPDEYEEGDVVGPLRAAFRAAGLKVKAD